MDFWNKNKNTNKLRVIKTARNKNSINEAANQGLKPLLKTVVPSSKIRLEYAVLQNKITGEIEVTSDVRTYYELLENPDWETAINWTEYYPYNFASPFAAYLIPRDLQIGERVFIEDLIEDFVGATLDQSNHRRLESCEAIWNGQNFEIQYNPNIDLSNFVG